MNNAQSILTVIRHDSGILQLTINRPEALNALNADLMEQFHQTFLSAKTDPAVKALLITGQGKAFCAGADIKQLAQLTAQTGLAFARRGQQVFRMLEQLGKPSLAAINGLALGGACELAMAATLRIASANAIFGQPEVKLGVIPGFGGTQRLARLIGKGRALDLCLTGRTIKAEEASAWGLISEAVPAEELIQRAHIILSNLIQLPPLALRSVMNVIDYGYNLSLDDAFELEATHFGLCCATHDKTEGVNAFIEKRAGVFQGE